MSRVWLKVCPIHGPVAMRSLTCPRPVSADDKSDPQATNACAMRLVDREYELVPEIPEPESQLPVEPGAEPPA